MNTKKLEFRGLYAHIITWALMLIIFGFLLHLGYKNTLNGHRLRQFINHNIIYAVSSESPRNSSSYMRVFVHSDDPDNVVQMNGSVIFSDESLVDRHSDNNYLVEPKSVDFNQFVTISAFNLRNGNASYTTVRFKKDLWVFITFNDYGIQTEVSDATIGVSLK